MPRASEQAQGDVANMAVVRLIQAKLDDHARRLKARTADLQKVHTNGVLHDKLELARQELRDRALRDMHSVDDVLNKLSHRPQNLDQLYISAITAAEHGSSVAIADALTRHVSEEVQ
jgi:hypothetical protein